jgi:FkbM family methyltransferase
MTDPAREFRRLRNRVGRDARVAHRKLLWRLGRPYFYRLAECAGGVYVYPDDQLSLLVAEHSFEWPLRRLICDLLRPGMTVIDAGANLGLYTVIAGRAVGSSGRVYAFEPSTREWLRARRCIRANQLPNVALLRMALSDTDGAATLSVCDAARSAYNTIGVLTHPDAVGHDSHVEEVESIRLDSFIRIRNITRVDLVKIDVEGAEELVLRGGPQLFSRDDAPLLLCEVSDWTTHGLQSSAERVADVLTEYGYQLFALQPAANGYALVDAQLKGAVEYQDVVALKAAHAPWFADVVGDHKAEPMKARVS